MALKGGASAIFEAQKKIAVILADWQQEFDAFKARKARRQLQQMAEESSAVVWPSIPTPEVKTVSKSTNPFEALNLLEDEESFVEVVPVVKPKKPTLTGWSKVVASAPSAPSSATSSATSDGESTTTSWADMSDDEE